MLLLCIDVTTFIVHFDNTKEIKFLEEKNIKLILNCASLMSLFIKTNTTSCWCGSPLFRWWHRTKLMCCRCKSPMKIEKITWSSVLGLTQGSSSSILARISARVAV